MNSAEFLINLKIEEDELLQSDRERAKLIRKIQMQVKQENFEVPAFKYKALFTLGMTVCEIVYAEETSFDAVYKVTKDIRQLYNLT